MFVGWRVVAGAFVAMVLTNGMFTYGFTVMVNPIREDFGASLEQVMYSLTLGTLGGLVVGPVVGSLIDRYSVRLLMTTGCLITVVGLYALAQTQSILMFSILFGVTMTLSMNTMSSLPGSAVVSRWFTRNRGKALGIAAMGTSLGGVIIPALLAWWVDTGGWRAAMENLALLTLLVITPFVWFTVRNRPQDMGLLPDGDSEPVDVSEAASVPSMGMKDIVRTPAFWLVGLSMGCVFAAFSSMLANLGPYAARLGNSEAAVSTIIAVLSVGGLVGKLVFGTAADRINLKFGLWGSHALLLLAFGLLLLEPPFWVLLIAATSFGLSTGGMLPVWNAMMARVFGVDSFGRAVGAMGPLITLCILPAFGIVGRLFDATGSYSSSLQLFGGVIVFGALLLVPLRLPEST